MFPAANAMNTSFRALLWPACLLLLLASTLPAQTPPSDAAARGPLELTSRLGLSPRFKTALSWM